MPGRGGDDEDRQGWLMASTTKCPPPSPGAPQIHLAHAGGPGVPKNDLLPPCSLEVSLAFKVTKQLSLWEGRRWQAVGQLTEQKRLAGFGGCKRSSFCMGL